MLDLLFRLRLLGGVSVIPAVLTMGTLIETVIAVDDCMSNGC